MDSFEKFFSSKSPLYQSLFYDHLEEKLLGYVIWKPLSWRKAKILYNLTASPLLEEQIWQECMVETTFSDDEIEASAGIITTVVQQIGYFSGIIPPEIFTEELQNALNEGRQEIQSNLMDQIVSFLCMVFNYTPDEVEDMAWPQLMKRVAQAEAVIGSGMPKVPLEFKKPEKPKPFVADRAIKLTPEQEALLQGHVPKSKPVLKETKVEKKKNLRQEFLKHHAKK